MSSAIVKFGLVLRIRHPVSSVFLTRDVLGKVEVVLGNHHMNTSN